MLFPDTKFYPQSLPSDLVKRSDLLNTLNEHLDKSLITIVAPSGYGKSVLISNWLDSFDITAAWISLDEYDNNFSTFLRSLISSLDKAFLGKLEFLKTFLSSRKLPTIKVLSNTLINELNKLEKSFLLVLDDFQTVSEPSVHSFIIQILENCPKSMRIVICSRNKMPFPIENYYKYNKILEIKSHDLKFNLSETSEFIRNSCKQDIDEYIIIKIHEITEGWVTGLRLMILHLNQINALNDPEKELYDNNYLTDHLFEEIISSEFVKYKSLLFVSAIPNRFCKDLCNELFYVINDYQPDRSSTRELISKLSEENLFLINLDNKNTWYRYHYLFRKFLIKNGEVSLGIEKLAKVNLAACNWFAAQGLLNEALQHALAANDQQTAATIIEDHYLEKLQREEWFTIGNWLSTLGDSVINQRPNLLLAQCWTNYFQFRFNELDENTCLAEKLLQGKSTTKLQKGQLELFKGIMCYWHDEVSLSLKHLENALECISEDFYMLRGFTEIYWAFATQMRGQSKRVFEAIGGLLDKSNVHALRKVRALVAIVSTCLLNGELKSAEIFNKKLSVLCREANSLTNYALSKWFSGLIHYYRNELTESISNFSIAQKYTHLMPSKGSLDTLIGLAIACEASNKGEDATNALEQLGQYSESLEPLNVIDHIHSGSARCSIIRGFKTPLSNRMQMVGQSPVGNMFFFLDIPRITYCRVLLNLGSKRDLNEAEKVLEDLLQMAQRHNNIIQTINLLSLQALNLRKQDRIEEAVAVLEKAIDLAGPEDFINPFLELGDEILIVLKKLLRQNPQNNLIKKIISSFDEKAFHANTVKNVAHGSYLTNRELDILEKIERRLQSKEIAQELNIAVHTVNSHLKSIYRKLEVKNRRQAVEKAKKLYII